MKPETEIRNLKRDLNKERKEHRETRLKIAAHIERSRRAIAVKDDEIASLRLDNERLQQIADLARKLAEERDR